MTLSRMFMAVLVVMFAQGGFTACTSDDAPEVEESLEITEEEEEASAPEGDAEAEDTEAETEDSEAETEYAEDTDEESAEEATPEDPLAEAPADEPLIAPEDDPENIEEYELTQDGAEPRTFDPTGMAVHFAYNSAELNQTSRDNLHNLVEQLRMHPTTAIRIEGHCDERGSKAYNYALGKRRAAAVRSYIVSQGIDAKRLNIISYGEDRPASPGHTEEDYHQNRRAAFGVLNGDNT